MEKEQTLELIRLEFAAAAHAARSENEGMVRVCARRAAGAAITYWLQSHERLGWGNDAMNQLRSLAADRTAPQIVRDAAVRLSTRVNEQFSSPFQTDPVEDSRCIINYLLESP